MEAMLLSPTTPDQSISKYNRNPRKMFHSLISRPSSENFAPSSLITLSGVQGGLIGPPPSISSIPNHPHPHPHHHHHHHRHHHHQVLQQQQLTTPPLLPLPISPRSSPLMKSRYSSLPSRTSINNIIDNTNNTKSTTSVQANWKANNSNSRGGVDVAAKKPRSSPRTRKQLLGDQSESLKTMHHRLGPDPRDLPNKVSGVLRPKSKVLLVTSVADHDEEISCSSIFSLAPPPSSLPLPSFSLKPKLAGGSNVVDDGAADNLRRLLRLR